MTRAARSRHADPYPSACEEAPDHPLRRVGNGPRVRVCRSVHRTLHHRRQRAASGKASASPSDAAPPKSPYWSDPAAVGQPYPPGKVQGLITFRGNPTRTYYGAGRSPRRLPPRSGRTPRTARCAARPSTNTAPCSGAAVAGRASRACSNGRQDLGRVRCLRLRRPLPERRQRQRDPAHLQDRRHHQGLGHGGPRQVPSGLHRFTRQQPAGSVDRREPGAGTVAPERQRRVAGAVERRLGRITARYRRLPVRGRRKQPVPHRQAQPQSTTSRARSRSTRSSCSTRRVGTRS